MLENNAKGNEDESIEAIAWPLGLLYGYTKTD